VEANEVLAAANARKLPLTLRYLPDDHHPAANANQQTK
jgi:hypothetical protein